MLKLRIMLAFALALLTCNVVAKDVYITGNDIDALQAAMDAANVPGSQVTIHLEAGQIFTGLPRLEEFVGNLTIEGNGAVFTQGAGLGFIAPEGVVAISGVTFDSPSTGFLLCSFIFNKGSVSLERVSVFGADISTGSNFVNCRAERLLYNDGVAELDNVTIVGTSFWAVEGSVIQSSVGASTHISHLTVVDTTFSLKGDSQISVLRSDSESSMSVGNSIILADEDFGENLVTCVGPITDNGGNYSSSGDCGFSGGLIDRDDLGQIIEKGHDAWVMPLLPDSVAVNAGNPDYCQKLDGRGFERGVLCDSGSYETAASNHGGELGRGGISGFYYTPESDGNYIQVQRAYDGNVVVIWNTFDSSGAQAWINAVGSYQDGVITADAYRNLGGQLQPGGGASGGVETDWGTIRVTAHNCWQITVEYASDDPEFGSGSFDAQRIAFVHDLGCSEF